LQTLLPVTRNNTALDTRFDDHLKIMNRRGSIAKQEFDLTQEFRNNLSTADAFRNRNHKRLNSINYL